MKGAGKRLTALRFTVFASPVKKKPFDFQGHRMLLHRGIIQHQHRHTAGCMYQREFQGQELNVETKIGNIHNNRTLYNILMFSLLQVITMDSVPYASKCGELYFQHQVYVWHNYTIEVEDSAGTLHKIP